MSQNLKNTLKIVLGPKAQIPSYATSGSAGMDLRSTESVTLNPGERRLVPTGLKIAIPHGFEAQIRPRSGLALKHGISMVNTPGTIDSDYRGEVGVILINLGQFTVTLVEGERIAQMVICPIEQVNIEVVKVLDETDRGDGGFGSTGIK